jgi:hypothetical protein
MPSSFEIFQFWPNFDARVQSTAFLHRQNQKPQMTGFFHWESLIPALAQTDVRDDLFEACRRELKWELRFPSVRTKFPVERFQRDQHRLLVGESFCRWPWNRLQPRSQLWRGHLAKSRFQLVSPAVGALETQAREPRKPPYPKLPLQAKRYRD